MALMQPFHKTCLFHLQRATAGTQSISLKIDSQEVVSHEQDPTSVSLRFVILLFNVLAYFMEQFLILILDYDRFAIDEQKWCSQHEAALSRYKSPSTYCHPLH
jgi:hypothetical protein|uniref:Uncharacterized protein n=1 Tax=Oryza sativa subsp. japonica TaxID=39947 RepID=Q5Z6A3_ORYSJ|nr:unknown protein [Oryza sativa Japonica Group]